MKTNTGAPPTDRMCPSLGCYAIRSSGSRASLIRCRGAASGDRGDGGATQSVRDVSRRGVVQRPHASALRCDPAPKPHLHVRHESNSESRTDDLDP